MIGQHRTLNRPVSLEEAKQIQELAEVMIEKTNDSRYSAEYQASVLPFWYETQNLASALIRALEMHN